MPFSWILNVLEELTASWRHQESWWQEVGPFFAVFRQLVRRTNRSFRPLDSWDNSTVRTTRLTFFSTVRQLNLGPRQVDGRPWPGVSAPGAHRAGKRGGRVKVRVRVSVRLGFTGNLCKHVSITHSVQLRLGQPSRCLSCPNLWVVRMVKLS